MRKSKIRKTERKLRSKNAAKYKREVKENKVEAKEKYQAWLNLPAEAWSDARKKHIPVQVTLGEKVVEVEIPYTE